MKTHARLNEDAKITFCGRKIRDNDESTHDLCGYLKISADKVCGNCRPKVVVWNDKGYVPMPNGKQQPTITTVSGIRFTPFDPRPDQINIRDIATALSHLCRWSGHVERFMSVGEHSILVSRLVEKLGYGARSALTGLLHDASEAYLADLPRPIKYHKGLKTYRVTEDRIHAAIAQKFDLDWPHHPEIKSADNSLLMTEAAVLKGLEISIEGSWVVPWVKYRLEQPAPAPAAVREQFLQQFRRLRSAL